MCDGSNRKHPLNSTADRPHRRSMFFRHCGPRGRRFHPTSHPGGCSTNLFEHIYILLEPFYSSITSAEREDTHRNARSFQKKGHRKRNSYPFERLQVCFATSARSGTGRARVTQRWRVQGEVSVVAYLAFNKRLALHLGKVYMETYPIPTR